MTTKSSIETRFGRQSPFDREVTDPISVAVYGSDDLARAGTRALLGACMDIRLVNDGDSSRIDVLVVVEDTVTETTIETIGHLVRNHETPKDLRCLLVTDRFVRSNLMPALSLGVVGVLSRSEVTGELLTEQVLAASRGHAYFSPELQGELLAQINRLERDVLAPNGLDPTGLDAREREILRLISEGYDTATIATKLCYAERTIKNVLYSVINRLSLINRAHAVAYAIRAGAI
ncbi:response regulator transcription factor [Amycolatopsis japonica]